LRHLLLVDVEYRTARGDSVAAREYKNRFPEHSEVIELALRELRQIVDSTDRSALQTFGGERLADRPEAIGRFQVVKLVGKGGFGSVFQAYDTTLDRTVAIKVPHSRHFTVEEEKRFLREGRSAARLRHPGIVPVYEIGRENGVPYIVSELIDGITLDEWRHHARPTFRETGELVAQIADALDYAHRQGVVHRDVKPSNIIIDDSGQPYLTDFGLARCDGADVTLTLDGQILGTPAYMSPEQACGGNENVDARADIYSLGVVLYEMLSGKLPFEGNAPTLLHQVVHTKPRSFQSMNMHIPAKLEQIVLKCLEKESDRRYATTAEVAKELRGWLRCQASHDRPRRSAHGRGSRRCWVIAFAGMAVAACVLLLLVSRAIHFSRTSTARALDGGQALSQSLAPDEPLDASEQRAAEEPRVESPADPLPLATTKPNSSARTVGCGPSVQLLDDFESNVRAWEAFLDAPQGTHLTFERDRAIKRSGDASLAIRYDLAPENWATCARIHEQPQDWSRFQGLTFSLHAETVGQPVTIVAFQGDSPDDLVHFAYCLKTSQSAVTGWQRVDVGWQELAPPDWQGDATAEFDPRSSMGIAFAYDGTETGRHAGKLWIDDIGLVLNETGRNKGE
jgi:serine/threonine protein kinase